jgi:hypothetical protein
LGVNDLEHYCQRLYDLWLEATLPDSFYRRIADDDRFFFGFSSAHVINLPRAYVWGLVAAEAGILKQKGIRLLESPYTYRKPAGYLNYLFGNALTPA